MKDIKNISEILEAVHLLVKTGKTVMKDGKVDLADLPAVMGLLTQVQTLVKAVEGAELVIEEGKDLSPEEIVVLVTKLKAIIDAAKA